MAKEHELELVHQAKQQQIEKEQQQELMKFDQRAEFREFVKQRGLAEEELKRQLKIFKSQSVKKKELNAKQLKDQLEKKRAEWQQEQDKKESEFLKQQRVAKEEEETLLRKYHENLVERTKEAAGTLIVHLLLSLSSILIDFVRIGSPGSGEAAKGDSGQGHSRARGRCSSG